MLPVSSNFWGCMEIPKLIRFIPVRLKSWQLFASSVSSFNRMTSTDGQKMNCFYIKTKAVRLSKIFGLLTFAKIYLIVLSTVKIFSKIYWTFDGKSTSKPKPKLLKLPKLSLWHMSKILKFSTFLTYFWYIAVYFWNFWHTEMFDFLPKMAEFQRLKIRRNVPKYSSFYFHKSRYNFVKMYRTLKILP